MIGLFTFGYFFNPESIVSLIFNLRYFTNSIHFLKIPVYFIPNNARIEIVSCFLCINLNVFYINGDILHSSYYMLNLKCMKNIMNTLNCYFDFSL